MSRHVTAAGWLLVFGVYSWPAAAWDYDAEFAALTRDLPPEVAEFIDRRVGCNYWMSEPPGDDERQDQIAGHLMQLRCDSLSKDERSLKRHYRTNKKVIQALETSKDWMPD